MATALIEWEREYHLPTAEVVREITVEVRPDVVPGGLGTGAEAVPLEDDHPFLAPLVASPQQIMECTFSWFEGYWQRDDQGDLTETAASERLVVEEKYVQQPTLVPMERRPNVIGATSPIPFSCVPPSRAGSSTDRPRRGRDESRSQGPQKSRRRLEDSKKEESETGEDDLP
eukprot:9627721-Alexandrium_andersonii.AAC.1